jgi:predicted aspartyl protease
MPALLDTGAGHTVLTPEAIKTVGLRLVDHTKLARAGGVEEGVGVYVACIQFPRYKISTIEVIRVLACELPEQPIQCLIGRDILSRWFFGYNGKNGTWYIDEDQVAAWVEPPEGDS